MKLCLSIGTFENKEVSINKGINIVVDFRCLPRRIAEGILGIFRGDATKAGGEKTDEIDTFIYGQLLSAYCPIFWTGSMYRLLLPGIGIKRWVMLHLAGMCLFAVGLWVLCLPQWQFILLQRHLLFPASAPGVLTSTLLVLFGCILLLGGCAVVAYSTQKIVRAFTDITHPHLNNRQLMRALLAKRRARPRLKIVGIGGGTGLSNLLRGLKSYPVELTAIVTVADDGGSSGRLRADLDMPPPGDIRSCLVALAEVEPMMERIFQYRFSDGDHSLTGHSLGNIIIAGMSEMTGDFLEAIQQISRVLAVRGRVIPSARQALVLCAHMADGVVVRGESAISRYPSTIVSIGVEPPDIAPLPEALAAISEADIIIVGPGSVYSSILPNLIIPGMAEALFNSSAAKFFICNVMTQPGESDDFSASRHLQAVLEQLPCQNPFHYAVVNLQRPVQEILGHYQEERQFFVEPDLMRLLALGSSPVTGDLLAEQSLARHNPHALARCILEKVAEDVRWTDILREKTDSVGLHRTGEQ